MSKLLTINRFWGPVATVLFTLAYHAIVTYFGLTVAVGWLWLFMIFGVFVAGLRAGLICAVFVALYSIYAMPPGDWALTTQRVVITFAMAGLVGYLKRRERLSREAILSQFSNGNVDKMRVSLRMTTSLKHRLKAMTESDILAILEEIESNLGNALAVIEGYKFLREEIEKVDRWYAGQRNVEKLKGMREAEDDGQAD